MNNNIRVENYANALVKHGHYTTLDEAMTESVRVYKKMDRGLHEPLKCPHSPDIEIRITPMKGGGSLIEYFKTI